MGHASALHIRLVMEGFTDASHKLSSTVAPFDKRTQYGINVF